MTKRVFIYARRSSTKNKINSISIEKQIELIQRKCVEKWLIIEHVYQDNQSSFKAWIRDDFIEMLDEIENRNIFENWNKIDYLYVFMTSRLARNRQEANRIIDLVAEEKLKILSISEKYEEWYQWEKQLRYDLLEAEFESKKKSEEAKIHMDITYRNKWKISTKERFWYKIVGRWDYTELKINNDNNEANIVKSIFEDYSSWNYTYKSLAKSLNDGWYQKPYRSSWIKNILFRRFNAKDIENVLIKPFYWWKVEVKYNRLTENEIKYFKETYPDKEFDKQLIIDYTNIVKECWTYEPLISKFLYDKCVDIREWKRWKNKEVDDKNWRWVYLFKWIIKCNCKKDIEDNINKYLTFTSEIKIKKETWKKYYFYRCSNNKRWEVKCDNVNVSEIVLEQSIIDKFIKWIIFSDIEKEIFEEVIYYKLKELWDIKENAWKLLQNKLNNLKKDKDKYYRLYTEESDEDFKEEHKNQFKMSKSEISKVENQIKNLPNISKDRENYIKEYIYYINELGTNFDTFPRNRKQKMLQAFFEYIIVYNKEIVDFKLNPIFELAYNHKKVLTSNNESSKSKKQTSNSLCGLKQTKKPQSNDYDLDGSPTRNRT